MAGPADDIHEGLTPIRASASVGSTPVPGMANSMVPAVPVPVAPPAAPAPKAAAVAMPAPGEAYTANAPEVEPDIHEGLTPIRPGDPRQAEGAVEHAQAAWQNSVFGLLWRQKMADLISDPSLSSWWERGITGTVGTGLDLPIMIGAAAKGGAAGAGFGLGLAGPVGAAIGGTMGGGAAMFAVPAMMRQTLIETYKARLASTPQDYWQLLRSVAGAGAHEGAIGAVTMGTGALAARAVGTALVPAIGKSMTVGAATKAIGAADVGAQIVGMVAAPHLIERTLPEKREFGDAAFVILTLKAGHMAVDRAARSRVAERITNNYLKTGKTPAEQVADAQANPKIAEALTAPDPIPFPPQVEIRSQMGLFNPKPVEGEIAPDGTRVEVAKPENATGTPEIAPPAAQSPEVAAQVAELARARLAELDAKAKGTQDATAQTPDGPVKIPGKPAEILTDAEKAERSFLTHNADNPEVVAKRYNIVTPERRVYTIEERTASEERVIEDVRRKLVEADAMRRSVGEAPLGDDHAAAVATLVRRQVNTFAEMHGVLPEDIYREMFLGIKNFKEPGAAAERGVVAATGETVTPEAARPIMPADVDMFGAPIDPPKPDHVVGDLPVVQLPVASLKLSTEVRQFKKDASTESGVVEPLKGKPDPTGWAIQVWERLNGDLEVISGRHRLDLWRRNGLENIPAQVHREADGFDAKKAAMLDAELNIRDEQGSVADYVQYFRSSEMDRETADARGLLDRAKGRSGFSIARDASPVLRDAHRAGLLTDDAALALSAAAPGSERLQALGMAVVNDGKSILMAANMMRSMEVMALDRAAEAEFKGAQPDIFGFDESAVRDAEAMAKAASARTMALRNQISAVSGASKRPDVARSMGVDVKDPEGIQKRIVELKAEQYQWDNWPLYPEIVAQLRAAVTAERNPTAVTAVPERAGGELMQGQNTLREAARAKGFHVEEDWYHGTTADIRAFNPALTRGPLPAVFLTRNPNFAGQMAGMRNMGDLPAGENILKVWHAAKNTFDYDNPEHIAQFREWMRPQIKPETVDLLAQDVASGRWEVLEGDPRVRDFLQKNFDSAYVKEANEKNLAVFDEKLVKSAVGNRGTFDTTNPDLLFQGDQTGPEFYSLAAETPAELRARDAEAVAQAKRKMAEERALDRGPTLKGDQADLFATQGTLFQDQRQDPNLGSYKVAEHLITLFEGANKSTVVHELGHHFLETLKHFAMKPGAPARVTEMWETARQEFAIPESGDIGRASHELNARSFERYLATGEAPSIALRGVFEKFRTWMLEIYKDIQNILGSKMNPEVKALFDKMLATDEEIAAARDLGVPREYLPAAAAEAVAQIVPPPEARRKIEPGFAAEQHSMQPFADELPRGPGEAPDNTHVNYAYINTPTDVKLAMQRMAEIDQANIQRQRGGEAGVKSWEQSNAEQAKYLNDILGGGPDTLKLLQPRDPNAAGVDVKLGVLKKLAVGAAKDSARLRDELLAAGHDATVRQQLEYMGSIERARMIQAEFLGERAGVARALNALKDSTEGTGEIARMLDEIGTGDQTLHQARTPEQEQAFMRAELDKIMERYRGKTPLDIAKLHKEVGTLKGTFKLAKAVTTATKWEMLVEGWRAGLLSGYITHTTNLVGTEAFHVMRPMVDLVAGLIGIARGASIGMGETDRAAMSESVARLTGMLGGAADGIKVGYHEFMADNASMLTESHREAIPGRAGELIRVPLRMMGAEDAMLKTMYRRGELHTLAIRQAFNEGGNPKTSAFAERVRELVDKPTEEMVKAADDAAARMTFNMPLGEKGVMIQRAVRALRLEWLFPFIRTPINIYKEMMRMTPLAPVIGEWRADFAKGGVARDRALAEVALGTALMALTVAYAFNGNITGAGSPDAGKQRGKAGVEQPYSWLINDTWYEYARIQPMGTLIGMSADMANIWDHMNDEERDKVPKMLAVAFANAITNQLFLQGLTAMVRTIEDPGRYGGNFIKQYAASVVPNVIGQPTTMADPYVREVNGALQAIQARLPILREQLAPKLDWLGQPVETKERVGMVLPIRTQEISDDKVRTEAARLDISMAAPPKKTHIGRGTGKLGDVELTPEEKHKFQEVSGAMAHKILTPIVNGAGWDALAELKQRTIYSRVLRASHQMAAVVALPMDKRLAYLQTISEKVQQELRSEEQQQ